MGLFCCGGRAGEAGEDDGASTTEFSNPIREQERGSYRDRISAALTRASSSSSAQNAGNAEKEERLLEDPNGGLCMVTSHVTNHPDFKWRGRGVRERSRIMREG